MASDKIYVHEKSAEELTENLPYHICYIRKDALLDKLNLALKLRYDGNPNSNNDGAQTIKAMINYIESL